MKKLILPFIFILVAALLPAQEGIVSSLVRGLTFSTDLSSGLWAHFNDKIDGDPFLQVAGADGVPVRVNLYASYATDDNNFGLTFTLRGQARNTVDAAGKPYMDPNRSPSQNDIIFFDKALAYIKMFNQILTFTVGYWKCEDFETPGGLSTSLGMEGAGLMLNARPVEGLNIIASGWARERDSVLLGEAKYVLTANYLLIDWVRATLNFASHQYGRLGFSKDDDITNTYLPPDGTSSYDELLAQDQRIAFGASFLGLKNFGFSRLGVDAEMRNLGGGRIPNWDNSRMIAITPFFLGERIIWNWNDLTLDFRARQRFNFGEDRWDYGPSVHMRLTAKYDFDLNDSVFACVISPKLGFDFFVNTSPWGDNPTDMRFDESASWEECTRMKGGWGISPAVELAFNNRNALLELGYSLKVNTSKPDDFVLVTEKSTVNHGVYIHAKVRTGI